MIDVNNLHPNVLWEIKRNLEIFLKAGSLTATMSRLSEKTETAIKILSEAGFCFLDMATVDSERGKDTIERAKGEEDKTKQKADHYFNRMDGGDQNGRFRIVPGKRLDAETLITMIENKLKPKTKKKQ